MFKSLTVLALTLAEPLSAAANAELTERAADSVQAVGVPAAVADVGTHGEDLYDVAKASSWTKASAIMDSLDKSTAALATGERTQLTGVLDMLRKAIASHDRVQATEAANRVTFIAAHLTEAYHPKMPADIVRLDYYGRELEIWAERKDMTRLASTAADLRRTWERVKPSEIAHGGAAAAATTDSLVAQLAKAKTVADYAGIAKPFLDVVDLLEKPFEK
jgi:multidrug efflux pump subunit AcrA (membrane-fusion protein)